MIKQLKIYIRNKLIKLLSIERGSMYVEKLKKRGLVIGENYNIQQGVFIDDTHCWLIEIGNNVAIGSNTVILAHDTSTKNYLQHTRLGKVVIGDDVFIGVNSVILPSVSIGSNSIIAAGSVVSKDVPENVIVAGSPAKIVSSIDSHIKKLKEDFNNSPVFDESYTLRKNVGDSKKKEMIELIENSETKKGFIE